MVAARMVIRSPLVKTLRVVKRRVCMKCHVETPRGDVVRMEGLKQPDRIMLVVVTSSVREVSNTVYLEILASVLL